MHFGVGRFGCGPGGHTSDAIDMKGFSSCTFLIVVGTIAGSGTVTCKVQQSSDDGVGDGYSDVEGSEIVFAAADADKVAVLEVNEPRKRYLKCIATTATGNGAIGGVVAIQTRAFAIAEPVTHDATTVVDCVFLHAPAEGTP